MSTTRTTAAERSRAYRLRRKSELSPAESTWLAEYTAARGSAPAAPPAAPDDPSLTRRWDIRSTPTTPTEPTPSPVKSQPTAPVATVPVAFPTDTPPTDTPPAEQKCDIPDCPACKTHVSGRVCATTGKTVWPPMSPHAASLMAAGLLTVVGQAVKYSRADRHSVPATESERKNLADGITLLQVRRASWIGAVDDLLLVGGTLGGYTVRAAVTPGPDDDDDDDKGPST